MYVCVLYNTYMYADTGSKSTEECQGKPRTKTVSTALPLNSNFNLANFFCTVRASIRIPFIATSPTFLQHSKAGNIPEEISRLGNKPPKPAVSSGFLGTSFVPSEILLKFHRATPCDLARRSLWVESLPDRLGRSHRHLSTLRDERPIATSRRVSQIANCRLTTPRPRVILALIVRNGPQNQSSLQNHMLQLYLSNQARVRKARFCSYEYYASLQF